MAFIEARRRRCVEDMGIQTTGGFHHSQSCFGRRLPAQEAIMKVAIAWTNARRASVRAVEQLGRMVAQERLSSSVSGSAQTLATTPSVPPASQSSSSRVCRLFQTGLPVESAPLTTRRVQTDARAREEAACQRKIEQLFQLAVEGMIFGFGWLGHYGWAYGRSLAVWPGLQHRLSSLWSGRACYAGSTWRNCKEVMEAGKYSKHKMYRKLPVKTMQHRKVEGPANEQRQVLYSKNFVGGGVEYLLPTDVDPNTVELSPWEDSYSYYFNRALRHFAGKDRFKAGGNFYGGLYTLRWSRLGDTMEFLLYDWIYDHEQVRTEDDGLVHLYLSRRSGRLDDQDCPVRILKDEQGSNPIPLHRPGLKLHRACSGRPRSQDEGRPSRPTPQPKTTVEGAKREKREAEDNREGQAEEAENRQEAASKMLAWMARIEPGCLIHIYPLRGGSGERICHWLLGTCPGPGPHDRDRHPLTSSISHVLVTSPMQSYVDLTIPTLLKMEFEGAESYWNLILKFNFCNHAFSMVEHPSSFHIIGKQMKIKYLRLAPEELRRMSDWSSTCEGWHPSKNCAAVVILALSSPELSASIF